MVTRVPILLSLAGLLGLAAGCRGDAGSEKLFPPLEPAVLDSANFIAWVSLADADGEACPEVSSCPAAAGVRVAYHVETAEVGANFSDGTLVLRPEAWRAVRDYVGANTVRGLLLADVYDPVGTYSVCGYTAPAANFAWVPEGRRAGMGGALMVVSRDGEGVIGWDMILAISTRPGWDVDAVAKQNHEVLSMAEAHQVIRDSLARVPSRPAWTNWQLQAGQLPEQLAQPAAWSYRCLGTGPGQAASGVQQDGGG
ncbi:MAG: hypothetical protein HY904_10175 [Deltaproteobacteria bacterium]|nr:hypothetical protein [Deltaproteobacteria bacterium]